MTNDWLEKDLQKSLESMTSDRDHWKNLAIRMVQPCIVNSSRDCSHCSAKAVVFHFLSSSTK